MGSYGLRGERGFTLIEVLVAAVVLVTGLLAVFRMLDVASHGRSTNRQRQAETSVAREIIENVRSLGYAQLDPATIASSVAPNIANSTVSGSTLSVDRSIYSFHASFTSCSLDDPDDGYGNHSLPPNSGGSWCPDVGPTGTADTNPDDYKRVSVTVTSTGGPTTPKVQQTVLIYAGPTRGPAISCLSVNATCPGANQLVTSGSSLAFNVTSTSQAAAIQWLVNGNTPPAAQVPLGAVDPYVPTGVTSQFTWSYPAADGSYTIAAAGYDANGNGGTRSTLQVTLNRHMAIPPASVNAGWNDQINAVDIQWVPSVDQDVLYYRVYQKVGNGPATPVAGCGQVNGTSCTDLSAPSPHPPAAPVCASPPQSYTQKDQYWVVGVDKDPTTGAPRESNQLSPKVDANLCDHPPTAPLALTGTVSGGAVTLDWQAPASPADSDPGDSIQAWRIYRWPFGQSTQFPGSRLQLVGAVDSSGSAVTTFTDNAPDPGGVTQSYCVTSVDTHLDESSCSNAVTG
jgi:prepilin-type N-terminal cleavage/methylation domain-containing protein